MTNDSLNQWPDNICADRHEATGKWVLHYLTDEQAKACHAAMGDVLTRKGGTVVTGENGAPASPASNPASLSTEAQIASMSHAAPVDAQGGGVNSSEISLLNKIEAIKSPFDDSYILRKDALNIVAAHVKATATDTRCSDCPCRYGIHCKAPEPVLSGEKQKPVTQADIDYLATLGMDKPKGQPVEYTHLDRIAERIMKSPCHLGVREDAYILARDVLEELALCQQ